MSKRKEEKKKKRQIVVGECALTRTRGAFVDCHLVPRSLTCPSIRGGYFIEAGSGQRPTKRWNSWYDNRLVTRAGEDVLEKFDDWAVRELRRHELVWSGWTGVPTLAGLIGIDESTGMGLRIVSGLDTSRFRVFLLSVLWRFAASRRPEAQQIQLPAEDLERLRSLVLSGSPGDIAFYPSVVTQISTIGGRHNMAPEQRALSLPPFLSDAPALRFYFDGLVVNTLVGQLDAHVARSAGGVFVGGHAELGVSTITFERSLQLSRFEELLSAVGDDLPAWARSDD